ncbi:MAG: TolC family protein [Saprospiraceae bacterium]|nr:TolC family protein [Saprospiraceae bacterium]
MSKLLSSLSFTALAKMGALLLFCFFSQTVLLAQNPAAPLLTPDEAVRIALEANFDIRISQADADIARLNNTRGNAGMLPTVNFVANENFTLSAFQQKLANGTEFKEAGATFNNANAGVQLSWTLFDGRRMQITKRRLEELESLGQTNLQNTVQQTTATVLQSYYDIVRGRLQERALAEVIVLNEERLRIAEARLAAGFAAQTDALQARIDLNQRRADLILQQTITANAKRVLNRLLVRPPDTAFNVDETLTTAYTPERNALVQKILSNNPTLVSLQKSMEIAALIVDENRALSRPRLTGNGQLNAVRSDNGAGFTLSNTQAGLTIGAGLVIPLYAGGNFKRQVETAQLAAQQSVFRLDNQRLFLESELDNQLATYQSQQQILSLEEENVRIARENLNVSTERFRLGTTNGLEPQIAQNSLEQALSRRDLVLFNLKAAEIGLRLLAGEL